jgi:hypothetical protein
MATKAKYQNSETDSTWERVKAAFANDWEQTKADFGADDARDMDQDVDDTLKQAFGSDNAFENHEQAFRFGHAAQLNYKDTHNDWNDDLDDTLRREYDGDYDRDRPFIRHAYRYRYQR